MSVLACQQQKLVGGRAYGVAHRVRSMQIDSATRSSQDVGCSLPRRAYRRASMEKHPYVGKDKKCSVPCNPYYLQSALCTPYPHNPCAGVGHCIFHSSDPRWPSESYRRDSAMRYGGVLLSQGKVFNPDCSREYGMLRFSNWVPSVADSRMQEIRKKSATLRSNCTITILLVSETPALPAAVPMAGPLV